MRKIQISGVLNLLLMHLDKGQIKKMGKSQGGERYVKKVYTYNHFVVWLNAAH